MTATITTGTIGTPAGVDYTQVFPTIPTNVTGDLLVAVIFGDYGQTMTKPSSAWTQIANYSDGSGQNVFQVYIYTAPAGTTANTWTQSASFYNTGIGVVGVVHSTGNTVTVDGSPQLSGEVVYADTITVPPLTTASIDEVVLDILAMNAYGGSMVTIPGGDTLLMEHGLGNLNGYILSLAYQIAPSEGAQTEPEWSSSAQIDCGVAYRMAFNVGAGTAAAAPTLTAPATQTVAYDTEVTASVTPTWASGKTGTVSWNGPSENPPITAGATTDTITIATTGAPIGVQTYVYTATATQSDGQQASVTFTLVVTPPPMYRGLGNKWIAGGLIQRAESNAWV